MTRMPTTPEGRRAAKAERMRKIRYRFTHEKEEAERVKQWRAEHPEQYRATQLAHRQKHRQEEVARVKAWRKANPEKLAAQQRRARERKRNAETRDRRDKHGCEQGQVTGGDDGDSLQGLRGAVHL